MTLQEHRGHVFFGELRLGATLRASGDRLRLDVSEPQGGLADVPQRTDLAHFRSSTGYFTLLGLRQGSSQIRLGVGGTITFDVRFALEDALFDSVDDIQSASWVVYVEDAAQVLHVTGLEHSLLFYGEKKVSLHWTLNPAPPVPLVCEEAGLTIELGQDVQTNGDLIGGPSMTFRYPAIVKFSVPVDLDTALPILNRIRQFFSLLMGRVLGIDRACVRLGEEGKGHDVTVHGLRNIRQSERPAERLVNFTDPSELAAMLDRWLVRSNGLDDAINLHFQGLEQRDLDPALRFQLFVQAIEAAHRRSAPPAGKPIDAGPILQVLRDHGLPADVVDRVGGVLAHAHESGLRQRLRHYWDLFASELDILRPGVTRKHVIGGVVATRNFYAHRTDPTPQVLQGADLWDGTELVKAISHLVILHEIEVGVSGLGQAMLQGGFTQFAIRNT